jgi:hypothetical protein
MSRSGLFNFENEPIWLIQDSDSLFIFNRCGRTVSVIRDTRFGIGQTVPAIRDTRIRLVVLVYWQERATPNDRLRPNAATTVDYRVGLGLPRGKLPSSGIGLRPCLGSRASTHPSLHSRAGAVCHPGRI